ncbi:hypothetical protein [Terasakiella sp.]|uniref:PDC sensor domain-containing protein n=1 Tax=Terasakiella sp. TaxID=2034861 RepID=UPI003B003E44
MDSGMLYFIALLLSFVAAQDTYAADDIRDYAEFQAFHAENTIQAIDLALLDASELIERNPEAEELVLHTTLAKYVERTPGLRAIISTDHTGQLKIDSFTYPAKDIDLSDREYVKTALNNAERDLYIGSPLVGRSSGAAFVPFARALLDSDKKSLGAIAGIIHPGFLIKQDALCPQCIVSLFNDRNEVLVSYPSNTNYPGILLKKSTR